jgi:beta-lactamase regulating signal transducer with metallopeptidase domain
MVLHHEMTHLLHKDLWAKLLLEIIRLMFFYNPVFKQAAVQLDEVCEQLCDQVVTADLTPAAKKDYGHLLLSMLEQAEPANKMTQAAFAKDKSQLKIRLEAIVRPARPSSGQQALVALAAVLAVLFSLLAMVKIIPEANKWDQKRKLLAEMNYSSQVAATSADPAATYPPTVQGTVFTFEDEQYIFD